MKDLQLKMEKCKDLEDHGKIFQKKQNKLKYEKFNFNYVKYFLFFTSCGDIPFDTSERGGVMMATDDKTSNY